MALIAENAKLYIADTKKPTEGKKWTEFAAQMRSAASRLAAKAHAGDEAGAKAAMDKLNQSCHDCHAVFNPEKNVTVDRCATVDFAVHAESCKSVPPAKRHRRFIARWRCFHRCCNRLFQQIRTLPWATSRRLRNLIISPRLPFETTAGYAAGKRRGDAAGWDFHFSQVLVRSSGDIGGRARRDARRRPSLPPLTRLSVKKDVA